MKRIHLPVRIRPMCEDDLDAVDVIEQQSFVAPWDRDTVARELQIEFSQTRVAVAGDGSLVGYTIAWHVDDGAHLLVLAVHPERRRHGVGRQLLAGVEADARADGLGAIHLEVRESNVAAQRLYLNADFIVTGRRMRYYPGGEDALVMVKHLEPPPEA